MVKTNRVSENKIVHDSNHDFFPNILNIQNSCKITGYLGQFSMHIICSIWGYLASKITFKFEVQRFVHLNHDKIFKDKNGF